METHQAIRTKRDTRAFAATAISDEVLERILRAGRMAGSAKALQPVRLIVVRDQAQKVAVAACGRSTAHIPKAAAVVVIVLVPEEGVVGRPFALFRGPFDAGRAAQNMMLAAWEMGITSCPVTLHDDVATAKVLGLPEGHYAINTVTFGYPEGVDPVIGQRPRLPIGDYVHWERW